MKKILLFTVIVMLFAFSVSAEGLLDNMWFGHMFTFSTRNYANPNDGDAATNNFNSQILLDYEFEFGVWGTAYSGDNLSIDIDFYTYLGNYFENAQSGSGNDLFNNIATSHEFDPEFSTFFNVGELYTLGLKIGVVLPWTFDWGMDWIQNEFTITNKIRVPNVLDIDVDLKNIVRSAPAGKIDYYLNPRLVIASPNFDRWSMRGSQGAYPFGLTFAVWEEIHIAMDTRNYADTDPAMTGQSGLVQAMRFETFLWLKQDIIAALNYGGVMDEQNISFSVFAEEKIVYAQPYMWNKVDAYTVATDTGTPNDWKPYDITFPHLRTWGRYGVQLALYGFSTEVALTFNTQDIFYSDEIEDPNAMEDGTNEAASLYWAGNNLHNRAQLGVQLNMEYESDFGFKFGFKYDGFANIRDFDADEDDLAAAYAGGLAGSWKDNTWLSTGHAWNNFFKLYMGFSY